MIKVKGWKIFESLVLVWSERRESIGLTISRIRKHLVKGN